jgi:hypothetical protein
MIGAVCVLGVDGTSKTQTLPKRSMIAGQRSVMPILKFHQQADMN